MAIITLTITESINQIISGIPEYVEFSTNVPSTIFFTIDGTDPDNLSEIAVGQLYLPTNVNSLVLKVIAISGADSSDILEEIYFPNSATDLAGPRLTGEEGIVVLPAGGTPVEFFAVDADGNPAKGTVIPAIDLEITTSRTNRKGEDIEDGSASDSINFAQRKVDPTYYSIENRVSSPNNMNANFDPRAGLIIVDGSTPEKLQDQIVRLINRPYNTFDLNNKDFYNEHLPDRSLVTSNLVRVQYNPRTGITVYYYRDSRENRWMTSIQQTNPKGFNLTPKVGPGRSKFVFRWVEDRYLSKIF